MLARLASEVFGDSLVGLRLVSALAAGLVVLCTGLLAREFGGGRGAQVLAAACMAVSAFLLAVGHLLSTATFDLLAWTALSWLVARALRDGGWSWLPVGVVAGIGLQNKTLVAFLLAGLLLRAAVVLVTGGKPYYLAGLYPVLLAAGAGPTVHWAWQGRTRIRTAALTVAITLSAATSAVLFLPLVPIQYLAATPIVNINYDAGETVGWPTFARTVAQVHATLPAHERAGAVVLTRNYGQAGAIDHHRATLGLPPAYSGHNSYAQWGPPPESAGPTIVVGYDRERLRRWFGSVELATRIDNGVGLDNDEQGDSCLGLSGPARAVGAAMASAAPHRIARALLGSATPGMTC